MGTKGDQHQHHLPPGGTGQLACSFSDCLHAAAASQSPCLAATAAFTRWRRHLPT